ncbi:cytotoxic translational repressor of toxin-antitoxin stability system [candidate division KSB1 bacterium]|nr:cytotoxic translational repressor of toxin-antitoxin stability system [candidate division KSB1 bacterium]
MEWQVVIPGRINKMIGRLPVRVKKSLFALLKEIELKGPVRGNWPNYSKLKNQKYHCHLKKGQPVYVAVWQVIDNEIRLIEVIYVGTHEKAPY